MNCKLFLALFVLMIVVQLSLAYEEEFKAIAVSSITFYWNSK